MISRGRHGNRILSATTLGVADSDDGRLMRLNEDRFGLPLLAPMSPLLKIQLQDFWRSKQAELRTHRTKVRSTGSLSYLTAGAPSSTVGGRFSTQTLSAASSGRAVTPRPCSVLPARPAAKKLSSPVERSVKASVRTVQPSVSCRAPPTCGAGWSRGSSPGCGRCRADPAAPPAELQVEAFQRQRSG